MNNLKEAAGFRIGDKVEIFTDVYGIRNGAEDIIIGIKEMEYEFYGGIYSFHLQDYDLGFSEKEIRHVRKIDNKLNRKLYPNYVPKDGYLVRPK